jgi:hypothetical protein
MFAPPSTLVLREVQSAWQNRRVRIELTKTLPGLLKEAKPDVVVIDLIDERFDIYEMAGSRFNISAEFIEAGINDLEDKPRIISRSSDEAMRLWADGLERFAKVVSAITDRIFVHQARWASSYVENGEIKPFPERVEILPGLHTTVSRSNALLREYESQIRRVLPNAVFIKAKDEHIVANRHHMWGLAPFHYISPYYSELARLALSHGLDLGIGAATVIVEPDRQQATGR